MSHLSIWELGTDKNTRKTRGSEGAHHWKNMRPPLVENGARSRMRHANHATFRLRLPNWRYGPKAQRHGQCAVTCRRTSRPPVLALATISDGAFSSRACRGCYSWVAANSPQRRRRSPLSSPGRVFVGASVVSSFAYRRHSAASDPSLNVASVPHCNALHGVL